MMQVRESSILSVLASTTGAFLPRRYRRSPLGAGLLAAELDVWGRAVSRSLSEERERAGFR